jgi:hypothetical protein
VAHGVTPDVVIGDPDGLPAGSPDVPWLERAVARPDGLAHDPARLARALQELIK